LQKLIVLQRAKEHWIVLFNSKALLFFAQGSDAILEGDNIEALRIAGTHRGLDTAIGQKASESDRGNSTMMQDTSRLVLAKASSPRWPATTIA
jgi:hypothetical protein